MSRIEAKVVAITGASSACRSQNVCDRVIVYSETMVQMFAICKRWSSGFAQSRPIALSTQVSLCVRATLMAAASFGRACRSP